MLKEVIEYVKKNKPSAMYQIEIKHNPLKSQETYSCKKIVTALNAVLEAENISQQTIVQSFDFECLEALQSLNSIIKTAYLTSMESEKIIFSSDKKLSLLLTNGHPISYYHNSLPKLVAALHGYAWDPEESELMPQQLIQAHQLGLKVMTWTSPKSASDVFNKERVLQLTDLGVDGIITDRPDLLIQSI